MDYDSDNDTDIDIKMQKLSLNARFKKGKAKKIPIPIEKTVRVNAFNLFNEILNDKCRAEEVEECIFKHAKELHETWDNPKFRKTYCIKVRTIKFNFINPQNPSFLKKVLNNELSINKIPNMQCYEMFPELYEPIFEKIAKQHLMAKIDINEVEDGLFKCPKCKSMKSTFYSLQTRGADEPMTSYIKCLECDYHWKD
jgi:transcription elongation factor S-II